MAPLFPNMNYAPSLEVFFIEWLTLLLHAVYVVDSIHLVNPQSKQLLKYNVSSECDSAIIDTNFTFCFSVIYYQSFEVKIIV